MDEASLKEFSTQAHKLGLLPGQAQGMVKFYNDITAKSLQDADSKALAARETSTKELKQEWGQAFDQKVSQAATLAKSVSRRGPLQRCRMTFQYKDTGFSGPST